MLQVCEHLERLRDYNSLFAAIAGLHNASLNRLKHTWAGVGPETHERSALEQLLELTKPNQNYSTTASSCSSTRAASCRAFRTLASTSRTCCTSRTATTRTPRRRRAPS
jgi:hypothetical protein